MRVAAIVTSAVLALGLAACGGDESEVSDIVPKSVPELTVGEDTGLPAAPQDDGETDTTSTTDTTETTTDAAPAAPVTPAPTQSQPQAPATGGSPDAGTQDQQQQQQEQGEGTGGFSDFCAQNPGACPGN